LEVVLKTLNSFLSLMVLLIAAVALNAQTVTVAPTSMSFTSQVGTTPAAQQQLTVSSAAGGTFFTATVSVQGTSVQWLKMNNASNPTPQTALTGATGTPSAVITVTADPSGLTAGTYNATIFVNNVQVPVTLTVASISVSPQSVNLGTYQIGSSNYPSGVTLSVSGASNGFTLSKAPADTWYTAAIFGSPASAVIVQFNQAAAGSLTVGTYNGTLTITPTGTGTNVPVNVPVTLTVTPSPAVTLSSCPKANGCSLAFSWQLGGSNNLSQQVLQFTTTSSVPLNYTVSTTGGTWLTAPPNGTIQSSGTSIPITVNGTSQQPGTYSGSVTITAPGGLFANGQSSLTIPVQLTVSNFPLLYVDKSALAFSSQFASGTAVAAQSVTPSSTGAPTTQLQYTLSADQTWITAPTGALLTGTPFSVSVNPASLAPGVYTGNVTVTPVATSSGQAAFKIPVTMTVTSTPALVVSNNALVFPYQLGQSVPAPQTVFVSSSNGAPLNYTVTAPSSATWLQLGGATTGVTDQSSFTVGVNTTGAVAGTLQTTVTVTATDPATGTAVGTPSLVDVKFVVSANPLLVVSPSAPLVLNMTQNSASPSVTLNLSSTNPAVPLTIGSSNVTVTGSWLSLTPAPASTPGSIVVSAATAGLTPGTYNGSIVITAKDASGTAVADSYTIPVTLLLAAAVATPGANSLSFTGQTGGAAPAAQTISITTNGVPLPFSAVANDGGINWLSVSNASGTTPGSVTVSVDASKLTTGTYFGAVYLNVPGAVWANGTASPLRIPVTFTVTAGTISAATTPLTFTQVSGGAAPAAQAIAVTGTPGPITYNVSSTMTNGTGWLNAIAGATGTATSGTTPTPVTVSVNAGTGASALPVGTYNGNVIITAPGATGSPITVPVVFNVVAPQSLTLSNTGPVNFAYTIGVTPTPLTQAVTLTSSASAQFTATATSTGNWLSVTPASGTASSTATTLTISANPTSLTAGNYTGTVTIASPTSLTPLTLTVNLTVAAVPPPVLQAIKNSASYATGAVAPGELVIVVGTNLGPTPLTFGTVTGGKLSTSVAGTQVLFDGIPAPIYYASAAQTAVFVPYEVAGRPTTSVTVVSPGATSIATVYNVVQAQPGIFTQNSQGNGPGSILNPDNSINGPTNGVAAGSYIQIFMTGEGQTSPAGVTGAMIPPDGSGLKNPVLAVTAAIGGVPLPASSILYAGSAPGDPSGVFQVDLVVPAGLAPGPQAVVVSVGGNASQSGVTVQVK
jgi:uncharacterized protein (TIGR03437 family)